MHPSKFKTTGITNLYGGYEVHTSEGNEADLHRGLIDCKKNPGHAKFVPAKEFCIQHLPETHRDQDLYDSIKAIAELTVLIRVNVVSWQRPEYWPNTLVAYPFHDRKGKRMTRSGSGELTVYKYLDGHWLDDGSKGDSFGLKSKRKYKTCPCEICQLSDSPRTIWWEVFVYTARHVVFDESEAGHTTCRLFYDSKDSPVVNLNKLNIHYVNMKSDWCLLKHVTCDAALGNKLYDTMIRSRGLRSKVWSKYSGRADNKFTFIVSHPHGCAKQISFGQCLDVYRVSLLNLTKLTYTTSTCPGSSGARVHCVGLNVGHVHNGALDCVQNYSSMGLYWS